MAVIQKTLFAENLDKYNTFVVDTDPFSKYFKITELADTFTGGKNAFLIQGSNQLVSDTLIKIEIKDSQGNTIYYEPGEGIISSSVAGEQIVTEYYEGVSKVVAVHIYPDTTFGPCTITILGELSEYYNEAGTLIPVPDNWQGTYNVKWQKQINVNPKLPNTTKIRFYKRPTATITETLSPIYTIVSGSKVESNIVSSFANVTLSKLDTFAGDVKRIKVYRTSEGDISDYDMIQDILVESKELLTSYELTGSVVGEAGLMTSEVLEKLWNYPTLTTELTSSRIDNGVKLNGSGYFTFTSSLNLSENSVYEFGIDAFYSASTPSNMGIYVSGSNNGEVLVGTLLGIEPTKNLNDSLFQFTLPLAEPTASLYLSQSQSEWHIGNLSLKLTQDTAFSPSEIGFTTSMPTVIGNETYNFKFEFYDVNNNYVPVEVTSSALFTGGNNNIGGTLIFISSSASASYDALQKVSSSISGTAALYSSSADTTITTLSGSVDTTIVTLSGSVSGSITTLSGSVSSSLTSLSSSVSASNALVLSSSFAQVKNLANGQYSGSFIGDNVIYSPAIGGQQGYIKELFTVGDTGSATINLDARTSTRKIWIGTNVNGTYNNTDTSVYLDSAGNFSLKDKLSFDGSTLSVNGTINVTGGNAATQTFANGVASNAVTSGSLFAANAAASASLSASAAQTFASAQALSAQQTAINVSAISASNAALSASAAYTNAKSVADSIANGTYSGGTLINSTSIVSPVIAGANGYISNVFKVGSGGITLDGTNKTIYIGSGVYANTNTGFYVDSNGKFSLKDKLTWDGTTLTVGGTINATAGTFSGAITSTATISGGTISGGTISGGTISIGSGDSIFKADGNGIYLGNATFANAPFKVTPNGSLSATNANLTGNITATGGTLGGWVIDGNILRDSASRLQLNPGSPSLDIFDASNVKRLTVKYGGLTSPQGGSTVSIDPPAGSSPYIPSISGYGGQTVRSGGYNTFSVPEAGTYYAVSYSLGSLSSFAGTNSSFNGYFSAGKYSLITDSSGNEIGTFGNMSGGVFGANGTVNLSYYNGGTSITFPAAGTYRVYTVWTYYCSASGGSAYLSGNSWDDGGINLGLILNITEVSDGGFQVLSSADSYCRIERGSQYAIDAKGSMNIQAPTGQFIYLNGTVHPYIGATNELGSTGNRWRTLWATYANNTSSDRRLKYGIEDSDLGLDFINILRPVKYKMNASSTPRYHYGLVAQELTASLSDLGKTTSDVGFITSASFQYTDEDIEKWKTQSDWPMYESEISSSMVGELGLAYTELISPMIKAIQQLTEKVSNLELIISGSI